MTDTELTPMQQKLYRSKALKRALYDYIETWSGAPVKGMKRIINKTIRREFIAALTDTQVMEILYYVLQCTDITQEERQQIETLLNLR